MLDKPDPQPEDDNAPPTLPKLNLDRLFPLFLLAWALLSWVAYAVAGEKMPWLFTHIAFPHIFLAAWGLGQWLKNLTWQDFCHASWLDAGRGAAAVVEGAHRSSGRRLAKSANSAGSGTRSAELTLTQLEPFVKLISATGGILLFGGILFWIIDKLGCKARAAARFRHRRGRRRRLDGAHDVYAQLHLRRNRRRSLWSTRTRTPDVKKVLARIDEISWRTTGTPHDVKVAYSKDGAWPFLWYMDTIYPNNYYYGDEPEAERLLECPVVIAGKPQWADVEEILGADYVAIDYKYVWWPIEDYKDLTWERIRSDWNDPAMRSALWDIIRDRDYTAYAQLKNPDDPFTTKTWPHRLDMRLYVRRDLTQRVWDYRLGADGADTARAARAAPSRRSVRGGRSAPCRSRRG